MIDDVEFAGLRLAGDVIVGDAGTAPLLGATAHLEVVGGKRKIFGKREGGQLTVQVRASGLSVDIPVPPGKEAQAEQFVAAVKGAAEQAKSAAQVKKKAHKQELKEVRAQERAAEQAARVAEQAARAEEAGELMESATFSAKTVKIYKNGFVRVGGPFSSKNAPYERLLSIEASADVGKKSGLGRGAGAVMTGGLNLLSSNKRGDVYLTIVTDAKTHVLHEDPPTASGMKASKKLEAAGAAVLRGFAAPGAGADAGPDQASAGDSTGATVAERLRQLTTMRDEGLVSAEEFESLRAKLLDSL